MVDFVKASMNYLSELGYKYTKRRADMLAVFSDDPLHYKSAKEVQRTLAKDHPSISFDTVYRNLRLFVVLELLEESEIDGGMVFRQHCDPILGHHHHFICTSCGGTVPVRLGDISQYQEQLEGYLIQSHVFQLRGLCPDCRKKAAEKRKCPDDCRKKDSCSHSHNR